MLDWRELKHVKNKTFVRAFLSHFDMSMGLNLGKKQVGRVLGGSGRTLPGNYGHAAAAGPHARYTLQTGVNVQCISRWFHSCL